MNSAGESTTSQTDVDEKIEEEEENKYDRARREGEAKKTTPRFSRNN